MKLEGKLFSANLMTHVVTVERPENDDPWVKQLERALIEVCHSLEAPIPLWLQKNTHEFASFHQTIFFADQFTEKVRFDRLQIRWLG
jgi:hypothetical protein